MADAGSQARTLDQPVAPDQSDLTTGRPWHALDVDVALKELQVDPLRGLSPEEAGSRLGKYGPNELTHEEKASPWVLFFSQFKNVLMLILIVATILSAFVGEYVDAIIILVIVVFCAVLGFVQEYRAERALDALKSMLAPMITVLRGGEEREDRVEGAGARGRAGAGGGRQDSGRCAAGREPLHPLRRSAADRRVAAGDQGADADAPGGAGGGPQEHGLHRNDRDLRPWQGGGVLHRHAERVRQDRSGSRCRRARKDPARAPHRRDRQVAGHHHPGHLRAGDRRQHRTGSPGRHLHDEVRPADPAVRDRAGGGRGSRGAGRDRDRRVGDCDARDGQAQRAGAQDAGRRNAGLHQRDLLRQDGHPDQGRDDGTKASLRRPDGRSQRRRLFLRRQRRCTDRRSRPAVASPGGRACERCRGRAGRCPLVRQGRPHRGRPRRGGHQGRLQDGRKRGAALRAWRNSPSAPSASA